MTLDDIKLYLPKYLSPDTQRKLFADLKNFPSNVDKRFFGFSGKKEDVIYQGDGLTDMLFVSLPDTVTKKLPCCIISNTCDIDPDNNGKFRSNVVYAPIIALEKYRSVLLEELVYTKESIENHILDIKRQAITQIFYLPQSDFPESVVFFDRLISIPNQEIDRKTLETRRMFSLSQYGHYVFLFKISIHFTRLIEGVDRSY